jgi:hypothetical protein
MKDEKTKAELESPSESIELARETMRDIKAALTRDAKGDFPPNSAGMDWDGMNMQPPKTAWQDMDLWQRYDLLLHVLDEAVWSLEPSSKWNEPRDSQKLALEFVNDDARQAMPGVRAEVYDALMTRLEAFSGELGQLVQRFGEFVGEAYADIAKLAEIQPVPEAMRELGGQGGTYSSLTPQRSGEAAEQQQEQGTDHVKGQDTGMSM